MRLVVLISGRGSNLKALIDRLPEANFLAVISDVAEAKGLQYAKLANADAHTLVHQAFDTREQFDRALAKIIEPYQPDFIVLAGFMRILGTEFVHQFTDKLVNIHPSLLPKFKGTNTHQRAIDAGEREHGASVHWVNDELDGGEIIKQAAVPIFSDDTAERLAARVLEVEHQLYADALMTVYRTKQN